MLKYMHKINMISKVKHTFTDKFIDAVLSLQEI